MYDDDRRARRLETNRWVLAARGWDDIDIPSYFTPVTHEEKVEAQAIEDEVVGRLFALDTERAQGERQLGARTQ